MLQLHVAYYYDTFILYFQNIQELWKDRNITAFSPSNTLVMDNPKYKNTVLQSHEHFSAKTREAKHCMKYKGRIQILRTRWEVLRCAIQEPE